MDIDILVCVGKYDPAIELMHASDRERKVINLIGLKVINLIGLTNNTRLTYRVAVL